jgi:3-oxoadipate enol-lactonase
MPFVTTPRLTVHYRTTGNPDGLPVLFVHGSFASSRWWQPLFDLLPDEIYGLALDLRGCGASDKPDWGYTVEEQAADLAAFVDALRLSDFDLVAHSSGGAIAIEYTLSHPGAPRTLTLVDSAPIEGVFTPLDGLLLLDQMKDDRDLLTKALAATMPSFDTTATPFFAQLVDDATSMAPEAFSGLAASLNQWNRFGEARSLTLPCLVIWGDLDQIVPRDAMTRTLIAIPGANNMEVLHNVGHSPMIEAPLALAERLIDFIGEDFAGYEHVRGSVDQS